MRPISGELITFLFVSSSLMAVIYGYVCWKFVTHSRLTGFWKRTVWTITTALFILNPLSFIIGLFLGRSFLPEVLSWITYTGMGFMTIAAAMLLIWDIAQLAVFSAHKMHKTFRQPRFVKDSSAVSVNRREFLIQSVNIGIIGAAALMGTYGFYEARRIPQIKKVEVPIKGLPEGLEGFHIAQITDIHIGPTIKRGFIEMIVERVNSLNADIVAVTGDLADGTVKQLADDAAPLGRLSAKSGVYFVTGNHEYYSGAPEWLREIEKLGLIVLMNGHRRIQRNGKSLILAGVTDYNAGKVIPSHKSDPLGALSGAGDSDVKILLAHQPRSIIAASAAGYDLQISGHTHGGQYFPGNVLVSMVQPYISGLHLHNNTWIYVSRGTGYWGPPMRIGAPSEITSIKLVRG